MISAVRYASEMPRKLGCSVGIRQRKVFFCFSRYFVNNVNPARSTFPHVPGDEPHSFVIYATNALRHKVRIQTGYGKSVFGGKILVRRAEKPHAEKNSQ